ncbi:uncharacterized protein F4822DRAFT_441813 [Hypoxylon trugodes]|uniref:uncharacterized protein n=1 Tax=Hypoxylon trugodes TaxID=326681 RepID=UPI00219B4C13|nr:uncharacterized protein F4822DRAFT_441813 [Hypoxylon trugodes]KAI1382548.1 hypothetical protein F4822DRAFT_441813 [Hypoxylon trugodes]
MVDATTKKEEIHHADEWNDFIIDVKRSPTRTQKLFLQYLIQSVSLLDCDNETSLTKLTTESLNEQWRKDIEKLSKEPRDKALLQLDILRKVFQLAEGAQKTQPELDICTKSKNLEILGQTLQVHAAPRELNLEATLRFLTHCEAFRDENLTSTILERRFNLIRSYIPIYVGRDLRYRCGDFIKLQRYTLQQYGFCPSITDLCLHLGQLQPTDIKLEAAGLFELYLFIRTSRRLTAGLAKGHRVPRYTNEGCWNI